MRKWTAFALVYLAGTLVPLNACPPVTLLDLQCKLAALRIERWQTEGKAKPILLIMGAKEHRPLTDKLGHCVFLSAEPGAEKGFTVLEGDPGALGDLRKIKTYLQGKFDLVVDLGDIQASPGWSADHAAVLDALHADPKSVAAPRHDPDKSVDFTGAIMAPAHLEGADFSGAAS